MSGPFHELDEHVGGEFVGLIVGGDADDGEVSLRWGWGAGRVRAAFSLGGSR